MTKDYKKELAELGCGDSGCICGNAGGMHTNGGCKCFFELRKTYRDEWKKSRHVVHLARQMVDEIRMLEAILDDYEKQIDDLMEKNSSLSQTILASWEKE